MDTGACRDFLPVCWENPYAQNLPNPRSKTIHTHGSKTRKLCQTMMYSLFQEPGRPDPTSSGTQPHRPLPHARCRSDPPARSKHRQMQQLSKTAPEESFPSKSQDVKEHVQRLQLPRGADESNSAQSILVLNQSTQMSIMWYWICRSVHRKSCCHVGQRETLFIHRWTSFVGQGRRVALKNIPIKQ